MRRWMAAEGPFAQWSVVDHRGRAVPVTEGVACLWAASQDMLSELRAIEHDIVSGSNSADRLASIRAVIARAEGRSV